MINYFSASSSLRLDGIKITSAIRLIRTQTTPTATSCKHAQPGRKSLFNASPLFILIPHSHTFFLCSTNGLRRPPLSADRFSYSSSQLFSLTFKFWLRFIFLVFIFRMAGSTSNTTCAFSVPLWLTAEGCWKAKA